MKKATLFLLAVLTLCFALPALAVNNAEFQGRCASGIPTACEFDSTRAPFGGSPASCTYGIDYLGWDFDTSISTDDYWYTLDQQPEYTYNGQFCDFIYLSVFCNGGSNTGTAHCMCNVVGIGGCIIPGAGWLP